MDWKLFCKILDSKLLIRQLDPPKGCRIPRLIVNTISTIFTISMLVVEDKTLSYSRETSYEVWWGLLYHVPMPG